MGRLSSVLCKLHFLDYEFICASHMLDLCLHISLFLFFLTNTFQIFLNNDFAAHVHFLGVMDPVLKIIITDE